MWPMLHNKKKKIRFSFSKCFPGALCQMDASDKPKGFRKRFILCARLCEMFENLKTLSASQVFFDIFCLMCGAFGSKFYKKKLSKLSQGLYSYACSKE